MIDPDQHALDLLTNHAPAFLMEAQSVQTNSDKNAKILDIHLEQFDNNPLLLYAALHFCAIHGITVIVQPPSKPKR